jgi:hypothetical protein
MDIELLFFGFFSKLHLNHLKNILYSSISLAVFLFLSLRLYLQNMCNTRMIRLLESSSKIKLNHQSIDNRVSLGKSKRRNTLHQILIKDFFKQTFFEIHKCITISYLFKLWMCKLYNMFLYIYMAKWLTESSRFHFGYLYRNF